MTNTQGSYSSNTLQVASTFEPVSPSSSIDADRTPRARSLSSFSTQMLSTSPATPLVAPPSRDAAGMDPSGSTQVPPTSVALLQRTTRTMMRGNSDVEAHLAQRHSSSSPFRVSSSPSSSCSASSNKTVAAAALAPSISLAPPTPTAPTFPRISDTPQPSSPVSISSSSTAQNRGQGSSARTSTYGPVGPSASSSRRLSLELSALAEEAASWAPQTRPRRSTSVSTSTAVPSDDTASASEQESALSDSRQKRSKALSDALLASRHARRTSGSPRGASTTESAVPSSPLLPPPSTALPPTPPPSEPLPCSPGARSGSGGASGSVLVRANSVRSIHSLPARARASSSCSQPASARSSILSTRSAGSAGSINSAPSHLTLLPTSPDRLARAAALNSGADVRQLAPRRRSSLHSLKVAKEQQARASASTSTPVTPPRSTSIAKIRRQNVSSSSSPIAPAKVAGDPLGLDSTGEEDWSSFINNGYAFARPPAAAPPPSFQPGSMRGNRGMLSNMGRTFSHDSNMTRASTASELSEACTLFDDLVPSARFSSISSSSSTSAGSSSSPAKEGKATPFTLQEAKSSLAWLDDELAYPSSDEDTLFSTRGARVRRATAATAAVADSSSSPSRTNDSQRSSPERPIVRKKCHSLTHRSSALLRSSDVPAMPASLLEIRAEHIRRDSISRPSSSLRVNSPTPSWITKDRPFAPQASSQSSTSTDESKSTTTALAPSPSFSQELRRGSADSTASEDNPDIFADAMQTLSQESSPLGGPLPRTAYVEAPGRTKTSPSSLRRPCVRPSQARHRSTVTAI